MHPLFHPFSLGRFECVAVTDGSIPSTTETFFKNAPADAMQRYGMADGRVTAHLNPLLVRTPEECILIDAGIGPGVAPTAGRLSESLSAAGLRPEDITIVLLTHGHADHAGGAVTEDGKPAFPKARYLLSRNEVEYWFTDPRPLASDEPRTMLSRKKLAPLREKFEHVEAGSEVAPGIRVLAAPGHTPYTTAVILESGEASLLYAADAIAHPIHAEHPEWFLKPDLDPDVSVRTRRCLLERAAADGCLLYGYHFPLPSLARVRREAGDYRIEMVEVGE